MIYHFPNLDTLRLVITSGLVAPEITLAPAKGGLDDAGRVWLEPSAAVPKKALPALRKLGVETREGNAAQPAEDVCCWLQLLPVQRDSVEPVLSSQAPVLFELTGTAQLAELVGEMLRLGNDRQSLRWLKEGRQERVLLRVIGPPYYSLLRALEGNGGPRAYVERAPQVWIEYGHFHAELAKLKPPEGTLLLVRPPRSWTFLPIGEFQDIYQLLNFSLPAEQAAWQAVEPAARLQVPVRLAAGGGAEVAEMWVLRDRAYEQVDTLVRNADDHLLERLAFAVGEHQGQTSIVLRVRPSKKAPPVLTLPAAVEFRPFQKLPNLFLPVGKRLQPPLRRDAVRQLLADDPEQIVWLYPSAHDQFVPQSLPDNAFRPLRDWVEYVLDQERQALQTWIEAARFDFADFLCKDELPDPKTPGGKKTPPRERRSLLAQEAPEANDGASQPSADKTPRKRERPDSDFGKQAAVEPSELARQLRELQQQFEALAGPLDLPERQALWPQLAELHAALGQGSDAAICWLNALWEQDTPPADLVRAWAAAETGPAQPADLDRWLALDDPMPAQLRALVACLALAAWGAEDGAWSQALRRRLPQLQRYLEQHEKRLGVRAVWLAWYSLYKLSAGDVLGLARTRDRLLERLLTGGLSLEYDLPSFLRYAGQHSGEKFRQVLDRVIRLRELAERWLEQPLPESSATIMATTVPPDLPATLAYAELIFAFGLARLGEVGEARRLQQRARLFLQSKQDEAHQFLAEAYGFRIEQALAGKPHAGSLPEELLAALKAMTGKDIAPLSYKVNRLRSLSRILEPSQKVEALHKHRCLPHSLHQELQALVKGLDGKQLQESLVKLLQSRTKPWEALGIISKVLELAPCFEEKFLVEMLGKVVHLRAVLSTTQNTDEADVAAAIFERALFLAAHFDRSEYLQQLIGSFLQLLESQRSGASSQFLDAAAGQCLRGLRKFGLREEINALLVRMTDQVTEGQELAALKTQRGRNWVHALCTLLHIAGGWLYFGQNSLAMPILEEAKGLLYEQDAVAEHPYRTKLACTYATTLGQAPVDFALQQFEDFFREAVPLVDAFVTTNTHFSLARLQVIEAVVLAVVNEDFIVGQHVRRWLDEDEYLVRRRIHGDLRTLLAKAGLP